MTYLIFSIYASHNENIKKESKSTKIKQNNFLYLSLKRKGWEYLEHIL